MEEDDFRVHEHTPIYMYCTVQVFTSVETCKVVYLQTRSMAVPDKLLTITFTMCLILSLKSATNLGIGIVLGGMKRENRPAVPPATMSLSHVRSFALECLRPFSVKSRTQLSSLTTMTTGTSLQSLESKAEILLSVSYGIALQKFERDEPAF